MPAEPDIKLSTALVLESDRLESTSVCLIPVAIPENLDQSKTLKADLEANHIPAVLEEQAEMDAEQLGGIPVLVPEGAFELASEIVGQIELNAKEEEDDFEEDEEDEEELEEEKEEEEWDEDEDFDEDEEEEEEEEEEFDTDEFEGNPKEDDEEDLDEDEDV